MGHKVKQSLVNSRIDFFYYAFRNILLVSIPLVIISAFILGFNMPHGSARISSSDSLAISVPSSCTLSSSVDETHSASIVNGAYEDNIGRTTLTTFCNDKNGYSVYAIGDSLNSEGNNVLVSNINNNYDIPSGTATSGDTSNWALKLSLKAGDTSPTPPTIIPPFDNYTTVPANWTKVATAPSGTTDMEKGSSFTTTYATYISPTQAAGTYLGQVKYLLTHPSAATPTSAYIMQEVAEWEDDLPNPGDSVQAIDIRDGKQYWVTRLADGNIWMTQNLDFDINANTTLNSNTTDLNVAYNSTTGQYAEYNSGYSQVNDIIYWQPLRGTISFKGTTVSGWRDSYTEPYSANKTDDTNTGHASLGNHYNWTVAIASNNSANASAQNYVTENSICPKGWRLPKTSPYNEFSTLANAYNITTSTNAINLSNPPLYFTRPGFIDYSIYTSNNVGYYWSSTVYNGTDAYRLDFGNNRLDWNSRLKNFGFSVRCVAR